ncbi:MAG: DUF21 domain-containing protein [Chlamydiia bacterium]|nr:DUF21 domain-containing protein [Chlamydiia bacterium]
MDESASHWLFLTLFCLLFQSFFSMMEMACVSFNRVRLQYYVNQGEQRALWLNTLIQNPSRLFGTTLVGVNVALQIGSECSRLFYTAVNLPASIAPLTQVILVLVVAELAPMFAARRYAEHVAFIGIPVIYASSKILAPVTWSFGIISRGVNRLLGSHVAGERIFITREELQKVFEEDEDESSSSTDDYGTVVANIFSLRSKTAGQTMDPLSMLPMLPSSATVGQFRDLLTHTQEYPCVPVYHRTRRNIVGIAFVRDLLRISDDTLLLEHLRSPWFLTRHTGILQVLKQFRQNKQSVAVVLSDKGAAIGLLTLDGIVSEVFGKLEASSAASVIEPHGHVRHVERSFSGSYLISAFNSQFDADIPCSEGDTVYGIMTQHLGHEPEEGETLRIGVYEFRVDESPLIGPKKISIRTVCH